MAKTDDGSESAPVLGPGPVSACAQPAVRHYGTRALAVASLLCHNGTMNLEPYIENVQRQLAAAVASGGDEARALAEQLGPALASAIRLALQDALAAAADEITVELAPGSVELRLRGREPEFVVSAAPADVPVAEAEETPPAYVEPTDSKHGAMSRINLRMSEQLRARIEVAASSAGLSVNAWLVRVAAAAADRSGQERRGRGPATGGQSYTGWAR
jgi:HicB family